MRLLLVVLLDGLAYAAWLFLVSAGLTFTYGVLRVLNLAHGNLYALGAYLGATLLLHYAASGSEVAATLGLLLLAAVIIGILAGPLIERVFLRRVYSRDEEVQLLLTFAISLILEDVTKLIWGVTPVVADMPYTSFGSVRLGGISYPWYPFLLVGVALGLAGFLWFVVTHTRLGKVLAAVIADREVSATLGIHVPRVYTFAFTAGAILAALGGALTAPMFSLVPGIGADVLVISFAVIAIGGLGSIGGAAVGSVVVGLARSAAVYFFPELDLFTIYLIMTLVLLFRPQGLFGEIEIRRI
ncbi:MAG: branched-chain amino acid ABC transporter permease [Acidobacteriia bacterium]|nr:branched-chain amino acid ABC transporter permease [Methyloceanibacter sp.]MCL6490561.1 branched-chain amino acid ABC transporter permease [Terriglobia bacterium]